MDITKLVVFLIVGGIAGWLAGIIMKKKGLGIPANIVIGIVGAFIGKYTFKFLGLTAGGTIGAIVTATVGAVLLLFIVGLIKKL